jgi:hypothetical protein
LGTALEQAVVGYGNPDFLSDANLTITITNTNAAQAARALVLNVTSSFGSLSTTRELVVPTIQKQYIVQNNTTGGQSITVKTSAGTGITVPNGRKAHLYVDGTNVIQMFDFVDINGGTIDGTAIGGAAAAAAAFTTLTASGATTLNGAVALGDAVGDLITVPGTINSNLLFTDNSFDIGASGATRPRNLFLAGAATIGGNLSVGGTLTLTGGVNLNGNVTVGDASTDTLTINSTITSNLIFTDNTYDIGASGATRPRNLFLAGNITAGGSQTLTGSLTVDSTTDSSSITTGSIQTDGGLGVAKALFVGTTANIAGNVTLDGGTANGVSFLNASKVLTTGSALTFDGSFLGLNRTAAWASEQFGISGSSSTQRFIYARSTSAGHYLSLGTNGTAPYIEYGNGAGLIFQDGASEQMRLTSTGLGIGTSSPAYKLDVKASGTFNVARFTGQGGSISTFIYTDTAFWYFGDGAGFTGNGYTGHASNNTLSMQTAGTVRVFIGATGNVGIGTSSPASSNGNVGRVLQAASTGNTSSSIVASTAGTGLDNAGIFEARATAQTSGADRIGQIYIGRANTSTTALSGYMGFGTSNSGTFAERMRLDSSGNLGLGVTPGTWSDGKVIEINTAGNALWGEGNFTVLLQNARYNGGYKYARTGVASSHYDLDGGSHKWYTAPSGTAGNTISFTQAMTLGADGALVVGGTAAIANSVLTLQETASLSTALSLKNRNSTQTWRVAVDATAVDDKILAFIDNATSQVRMALTDTGNLGLGVTPSAWGGYGGVIQLKGAGFIGSANTNMQIGANWFYSGTDFFYITSGQAASYYRQNASEHAWFTAPSGTAGNTISFTQAMTLTAGGNLGIGTTSPNASAILDAQSTTKGVRMPNMTTTQKNAIASPAAGLMVYDTTLAKLCVYTTAWETITSL